MWKTYLIRVLLALVILVLLGRLLSYFSSPKFEPGSDNGKLAECPSTPNCVSSQVKKSDSGYINPLRISLNSEKSIAQLAELIAELPRTKIVAQENDYLYFEFRSFLFGFVDDVEFQKDRKRDVIHVRSASRFGYSDMGANRRRIEQIRNLWETKR